MKGCPKRLFILIILMVAGFSMLFPLTSHATIITYQFTGQGIPDDMYQGYINISMDGDTISGTFTLDDSLFDSIEYSLGTAEQEYPLTSLSFSWTRVRDGITYTDTFNTVPVEEITYYPELRLNSGSTDSSLIFYNFAGTGAFSGDLVVLSIDYSSYVANPNAVLTNIDYIHLNYFPSESTWASVHAFFDNIDISNDSVPVPEPSTMFLLGSGLLGLWGFRKKFKE